MGEVKQEEKINNPSDKLEAETTSLSRFEKTMGGRKGKKVEDGHEDEAEKKH